MAITRPVTKTIISTTDFGIPVVDQLNANTTAIAGQVPTAWANITLQNGWTADTYGRTPQYRKVGDLVYFRGLINGTALNVAVFTMPVGFRAAHAGIFTIAVGSGTAGQLAFGTDGIFQVLSGPNVTGANLDGLQYSLTP